MLAQIGVGRESVRPEELLRGYHEACAALDTQSGPVCFFEEIVSLKAEPAQSLGPVIKAIRQGEKVDAALLNFLAGALPSGSARIIDMDCRAHGFGGDQPRN